MQKTAITPTREQDYPKWYQNVIAAADLAEMSPVRGCMVIKPWGYAIWELIQQELDTRLKNTGHVNAYFPLLIPMSFLAKEAQHVEGFAKECAVVTHHRLTVDKNNQLQPDAKLEEPLVIRPTSETMIGSMYAKWIQSYRDLPILINQWANIMRWEMRPRIFLRTTEFLWQEGHTAHATKEEAIAETLKILDLYADFAQNFLAMPVITGKKTCTERFPGAVDTFSIEAMMQDYKALQAGTSHFLGQNFAKAFNIQFLSQADKQEYVWTSSWGVTTRLIGGIIMTHGDDNGLVLPPCIAPFQITILPIYQNDTKQEVLKYCEHMQKNLQQKTFNGKPLRIHIDDRDIRGGEKNWQWIKKGVPIRLEIGPRDVAKQQVVIKRRDLELTNKQFMQNNEFLSQAENILNSIQNNLLTNAQNFLQTNSHEINNLQDFKDFFGPNNKGGFASCYAVDEAGIEQYLKPLKITARCIPQDQKTMQKKCIFTGRKVTNKIIFAKAY